ncbi:MAG: anti-sigma factor family protein, partial [Longimicrobiales bacterium]
TMAGLLDAAEAREVDAHLARCADCATERDLVAALRSTAQRPPAGLDRRIVRAISVPPARTARSWVRPLAIAAVAAFAVITGSLIVRSGTDVSDVPVGDMAASVAPAWPSVQDPILRVTPVLHDLSVEELESLLAELES